MMITKLHVNSTTYILHEEVSPAELATNIESAARAGGAFVDICTADGVERSLLITPALLIEFEPVAPDSGDSLDLSTAFEPQVVESETFAGLEPYSHRSYFTW
jgi:hypothetical protein